VQSFEKLQAQPDRSVLLRLRVDGEGVAWAHHLQTLGKKLDGLGRTETKRSFDGLVREVIDGVDSVRFTRNRKP
jgi:hypothetical protein